jgi:hypothetical protein
MSTAPEASELYSSQASLAVMGKRFIDMKLWDEVRPRVHIRQKVMRHTPQDKLLDCFISILAGGHGLVEVNTRVRPDRSLQRAFGRTGAVTVRSNRRSAKR